MKIDVSAVEKLFQRADKYVGIVNIIIQKRK
jgi:hypothetical protein